MADNRIALGRQIYDYFVSRGLAPHQAAAIAGNMAWEGGGRTDLVNPGDNLKNSPHSPHSVGVGQWNDRLPALVDYARRNGASIPSGDLRDVNYVRSIAGSLPLSTQLGFAWEEMQGPERRAYEAVARSQDLRDATAGAIGYHRPAGWTRSNPYAGHGFDNRYALADQILKAGASTSDHPAPRSPLPVPYGLGAPREAVGGNSAPPAAVGSSQSSAVPGNFGGSAWDAGEMWDRQMLDGKADGGAVDDVLDEYRGPQMKSYVEPWYRRFPNRLTDKVYGPDIPFALDGRADGGGIPTPDEVLSEYNDPVKRFHHKFPDQPIVPPWDRPGTKSPVTGSLVPYQRPADWAVRSGVAEGAASGINPMVIGHGVGSAIGETAAAIKAGDYGHAAGVAAPMAAMAVMPGTPKALAPAVARAIKRAENVPLADKMFVQHNLTADNLAFADRNFAGQLPVPSLGVAKAGRPLEGFGEITLLGDPGMAKPSRTNPVFSGDAYSARFPDLSVKLHSLDRKAIDRDIRPFSQGDEFGRFMEAVERYRPQDMIESPALMRRYLREKGQPEFTLPDTTDPWRVGRALQEKMLADDGYRAWASDFVAPHALTPNSTLRINKGYSDTTGAPKYAPFSLDNVVKAMKGGADNEGFDYGMPNTRAALSPRFGKLDEVQAARDRIQPRDQWEAASKAIEEDIYKRAAELRKAAKYPPADKRDEFRLGSDTVDALHEALRRGEHELHYLFDKDKLPPDTREWLQNTRNRIRELGTDYFEVKPQRAVGLGEFTGAVVPENASASVLDTLKRHGINRIERYDGTPEGRTAAIQRYKDLFFAAPPAALIAGGMANGSDAAVADGPRGYADGGAVHAALRIAEKRVNRDPSDAQKEAGNYAKGHVTVHGLDITIENPKGSERSGTSKDGKRWSVKLPATYGYVKGTEGFDGDHVDVYLGHDHDSKKVFVIDQVDAGDGSFDEHKAMLSYPSKEAALADYRKAFSDGKADDRIGAVTEMSVDQFKDWVRSPGTLVPLGDIRKGFADGGSVSDILSEYNTDPMKATLSDPLAAYRTQYRDAPAPWDRPGTKSPVTGSMQNPGERPADWAVKSGVAETVSPTMGAYGVGSAMGEVAGAIKHGDYKDAVGAAIPLAAMAVMPGPKGAPKTPRAVDPLGYYSGALEAARNLPQAKGTPEQMLAVMQKSGAKAGEIEGTGLGKFLEGKSSVTRDEIANYLERNRVGLNEVVRGVSARVEPMSLDDWVKSKNYGFSTAAEWASQPNRSMDRIVQRYNEYLNHIADNPYKNADAKWMANSLDPHNPTYKETVLHMPANSVERPKSVRPGLSYHADGVFQSNHLPEPNIVGHMMTSMNTHEGKPVFTIDQIQSDWGQRIRDGGVRDEAKIADLRRQMDAANATLDARKASDNSIPGAWTTWPEAADLSRISAELRAAENAPIGHPLVNTTDQWTNTTLRRALQQAVESNAEGIAIPTGDTVLTYNPGDTAGMHGFYGRGPRQHVSIGPDLEVSAGAHSRPPMEGIVPKNLRKMLLNMDRDHPGGTYVDKLETPSGMKGQGFTYFPLTPKVKEALKQGLPLFSTAPIMLPYVGGKEEN